MPHLWVRTGPGVRHGQKPTLDSGVQTRRVPNSTLLALSKGPMLLLFLLLDSGVFTIGTHVQSISADYKVVFP